MSTANLGGAIYAALRLQQLQATTGKDYKTLVAETEARSAAITKQERRLDELRREVTQCEAALGNLHELSSLKDNLERHRVTPQQVDRFIEYNAELSRNGFTTDASTVLAKELRRIGSTPIDAAATLVHLSKEHGDLGTAVRKARELCRIAQAEISRMGREFGAKKLELDTKNRELKDMDSLIEQRHNTYDELEKKHNATVAEQQRRAAEAQSEFVNFEKGKTRTIDAVNQVIADFKESLGRIDTALREKRQLRVLSILMQEPGNSMSPDVVLPVSLLAVDALERYIALHRAEVPGVDGILASIRKLRMDLTSYVRYSAG